MSLSNIVPLRRGAAALALTGVLLAAPMASAASTPESFAPLVELFKNLRPEQQRPEKLRALGSGFIIDPAGYVVTNNHVVGNATDISVTLADGTILKGKLVGKDEKTDLALVKVEAAQPLPAVPWGNSDAAQVGDWVITVGNPFGLG